MPTFPRVPALSRRTLLAGAASLPALALPGMASAAGERPLRVGLIGCGGRGTGAAIQAALADPAVEIVALADRFADQLDSSLDVISGAIGERCHVPPAGRFVGVDAAEALLGGGVDLVILATPPHCRPDHLARAVAAGAHVWCETPAAIDPAGLEKVGTTLVEAERRRLVVGSGLCGRFDPSLADLARRIGAGAVGPIESIVLHHDLNLPWWKPAGKTAEETRTRNWIAHPPLSGGPFVEHHIHALDRALWLLGDDEPVAAMPATNAPHGDGAGAHVRYEFASGATIDAFCRRSSAPPTPSVERVVGRLGQADLLANSITTPAGLWQAPLPATGSRGRKYQSAMDAMLRQVRSGGGPQGAAGRELLRATALAVMGRMAATGRTVAWSEVSRAGVRA